MATHSQWGQVGNTPLLLLRQLSHLTGCHIWGKAEYLNPGGSVKDRAARGMITAAEQSGSLQPGGRIVEGTAGNTGIGLAHLGVERGYQVSIFMPNNQANEKVELLRALGVDLHLVAPCPFRDSAHFYHQARQFAETHPGSVWMDQFENPANAQIHYETTGPEIFQACPQIDFLTLASGTGGTIGGTSHFLKQQNPNIRVVLADPQGSALFRFVREGELKAEGSSITEGIGISRLTANFKRAVIDDALQIQDRDLIDMLFFVAQNEGLFLGTSSALNLCAAWQLGLAHRGSGKNIVTVLCDSGTRYASKLLNKDWLNQNGFNPNPGRIAET
ncbi:MAG: cysteine synthase A [Acidobacteria bacterium]|nr:cysteine synthase A [Acidobacteriota bacterium]MCB9398789.1 cysteine synthase A [Acidobacteriota bacterium]